MIEKWDGGCINYMDQAWSFLSEVSICVQGRDSLEKQRHMLLACDEIGVAKGHSRFGDQDLMSENAAENNFFGNCKTRR